MGQVGKGKWEKCHSKCKTFSSPCDAHLWSYKALTPLRRCQICQPYPIFAVLFYSLYVIALSDLWR